MSRVDSSLTVCSLTVDQDVKPPIQQYRVSPSQREPHECNFKCLFTCTSAVNPASKCTKTKRPACPGSFRFVKKKKKKERKRTDGSVVLHSRVNLDAQRHPALMKIKRGTRSLFPCEDNENTRISIDDIKSLTDRGKSRTGKFSR